MRTNGWPMVPLGEVLFHRKEFVRIDDLAKYKRCRVQLHGKGVVLRDEVEGAVIKTKTQQLCRTDELLVAEIDAKVGGYGLVPPELDGAIVSSHYFLFPTNRDRLIPQFLDCFVRTRHFRDQVAARGSTNYAAIRPQHVLQYTIPLPPLSEQRRIVAKIERLAAKIEEGHTLRRLSLFEADAAYQSAMHSIWSSSDTWKRDAIGNVVKLICGQIDPRDEPYASLPHINGESMESNTGRLLKNYRLAKEDGVTSGKYHFQAGVVLYSKIRPYLRKAVLVPFEGICSADVYAIQKTDDRVDSRFLKFSLLAPDFTSYANEISGRTRMPKLNQKQLFAYELPFPDKHEQRRIVEYLDGLQAKVDELKRLQAETAATLDALLPAILDRAFKGEL